MEKVWRNKALKDQTKQYLIIGVAAMLVIAFAGAALNPLDVLSVDRIWLEQRGFDGGDGELQDGVWRILATTSDSNVQFLRLNQEGMESFGEFPSDVNVNGEIYVTVSQKQSPYWVIPITNLGIVEVTPEMKASKLGITEPTGDVLADSVSVNLWDLNLAEKTVVIPFEVTATKVKGENISPLTTDDERATKIIMEDGEAYLFSFSQSDIIDGDSDAIIFYNPLDVTETMKLNLLWSFGDYDRYGWNDNLLFITTPDGGSTLAPTTEMTFLAANEPSIRQQLNWQSGNDWTFNRYWYGGGNTFKGTTVTYSVVDGNKEHTGVIIEQSGKSIAKLQPEGYNDRYLLTEGYVHPNYLSGGPRETGIYEYAGWYTPSPNAVELIGNAPSDWDDWRFPLSPNINSNPTTTPDGLSILNYLASSKVAPVTGYSHTPFARQDPDVWGYGAGGNIGVGGKIGVVLPPTARSWLFTLDVSTQLADTVVVQENYVNVDDIEPIIFDRYVLSASETAYGSVTLKNLSPWGGRASVSVTAPSNLINTVQIAGGGSYWFDIGEEKIINFQITNTGLLDEEQTGTFTFSVVNEQPYETAHDTFVMTFKPGIGVPDSTLSVTVVDADSGAKIGGITIKAVYGVDDLSKTVTTDVAGECSLEFGKYTGLVALTAVDYQSRYESEEQTVQVQSGDTSATFHLIKLGSGEGDGGIDWEFMLAVFGVGSMGIVAIYLWRRKR